jgi:O-acetyl-ADP-ribose deacetylase (regulator of RNase III)
MPHFGEGKANAESIAQATRNALRLADSMECKSIAVPAIGCGIAGFPLEQGAAVILREIHRFRPARLRECMVVLFSDAEYRAFERAARRI